MTMGNEVSFKHFTVSGRAFVMEIRSELGDHRFKAICEELDRAVSGLGKIRLVIVIRHYPSFNSAEDFLNDLRFLRLYDNVIEKTAVVCDRSWKETWVGLFSLFSGIQMAFFDDSNFKAALRWAQG